MKGWIIHMGKYKLVQKPAKMKNKFIVTIKADSNDADYLTETETYTKRDFEQNCIDDLIELNNKYGGSYELENYQGRLVIPSTEMGYCHSLEDIKVEYVDENGHYWDVKIDYKS